MEAGAGAPLEAAQVTLDVVLLHEVHLTDRRRSEHVKDHVELLTIALRVVTVVVRVAAVRRQRKTRLACCRAI